MNAPVNAYYSQEISVVQMSHDVREIGTEGKTARVCLRCGGVPGSARFERGCRTVALPRSDYVRPRRVVVAPKDGAGVPVPESDRFSAALEEYFGTADSVGGLISRMGRDLEGWSGSGNTADGVLPRYLTSDQGLFIRICATWRILKTLPGIYQRTLSDYYQGNGDPVPEIITLAHQAFFAANEKRREEAPKRQRFGTGKTFTVPELAEMAGVTPRHMRSLLENAKVGTIGPRPPLGQPPRLVTEEELNQLKDL